MTEIVRPALVQSQPWWDRYLGSLNRFSPTALKVLGADCDYIVEHAVRPNDPPGGLRRGVVMGSIQSGKTASMLGVAARSIDAGVDLVVILCGTKLSLWRQTYDRYLQQLDPPVSRAARGKRRLLVPDGTEGAPSELYSAPPPRLRRLLRERQPLVALVMKQADHLRAFKRFLHAQVFPAAVQRGGPYRMVVLDDEADDGSIIDAGAEVGADLTTDTLKVLPRLIADLWSDRAFSDKPCFPDLSATYIAYTATPQANFLQADLNPLAPQEFVVALRTPADHGSFEPRQPTYQESRGPAGWYTGGEIFYQRLSSVLILEPSDNLTEAIADATRAFLVAGAIRLWRQGTTLHQVSEQVFDSEDAMRRAVPPPHTMLIHPSVRLDEHRQAAVRLLGWAWQVPTQQAERMYDAGERRLSRECLAQMMQDDPSPWQRWLYEYQRSSEAVTREFSCPPRPVPSDSHWDQIARIILDEIVPAARISVVNSEAADDVRPDFSGSQNQEGSWLAPRDLCTIFVSGNVMSRGLTLEGLSTTLFYRGSDSPAADTQMQMQRWFGYRGHDIELCRVFLPRRQQELFIAYHQSDEALRRQVLDLMNQAEEPPDPTVLGGMDFTPTAKITNLSTVPLSPGARPMIALMSSGAAPDPNTALLARCFADQESVDVVVGGVLRGRALRRTLGLGEAATIFDSLRYDTYTPQPEGWMSTRWANLERIVKLDPGDEEFPLYRPPAGTAPPTIRADCPYSVGAYLRLWACLLQRRSPGLCPTDRPTTPWSMLDLDLKAQQQPRFYVGIRYGRGPVISSGALAALPFQVRTMTRTVEGHKMQGSWGSQNPEELGREYLGDHLFDYHISGLRPDSSHDHWRPVGHPGLILFQVVDRGTPYPTVAVGLALPLGGPEQFAVRANL